MTELDKWQPRGEPVHPFDVFYMINEKPGEFERIEDSPEPVDMYDYRRNILKHGQVFRFSGKLYFESTCAPYVHDLILESTGVPATVEIEKIRSKYYQDGIDQSAGPREVQD